MPGPPPKDPKTRQRANKYPGETEFVDPHPLERGELPELPETIAGEPVKWCDEAREYWRDIWTAAVAVQYTRADFYRILVYVRLFQRWLERGSMEVLTELRLQGSCLGVTPMDRRRLHWHVRRGDDSAPSLPKPPERTDRAEREKRPDPRAGLRSVK